MRTLKVIWLMTLVATLLASPMEAWAQSGGNGTGIDEVAEIFKNLFETRASLCLPGGVYFKANVSYRPPVTVVPLGAEVVGKPHCLQVMEVVKTGTGALWVKFHILDQELWLINVRGYNWVEICQDNWRRVLVPALVSKGLITENGNHNIAWAPQSQPDLAPAWNTEIWLEKPEILTVLLAVILTLKACRRIPRRAFSFLKNNLTANSSSLERSASFDRDR